MIDNLIKSLEEWNTKHFQFNKQDDFIKITTPYVDMHHDYIQVFLTKENSNNYKLTDDGYIIDELDMLDMDVKNTKKRKAFFEQALHTFGVNYEAETRELSVTFDNISDYPQKQQNLLQCMLRISDMLLTSQSTIISIFTEEITNFFEDKNVLYTPDLGFNGKSGNQQTFEFDIPHFKNNKEKIIKVVNTPTTKNYINYIFPFIDIRDVRQNADFLIIANDLNTSISDKFYSPFANYGIDVLVWSKREEWYEKLKVV